MKNWKMPIALGKLDDHWDERWIQLSSPSGAVFGRFSHFVWLNKPNGSRLAEWQDKILIPTALTDPFPPGILVLDLTPREQEYMIAHKPIRFQPYRGRTLNHIKDHS